MNKSSSRFSVLVVIYGILLLAWFASWLTIGDAIWWLVLVNRVVPYFFILVPLFFIWGILSHRLRSTVTLLIPCLIFVWIYPSHLFPTISSSDQGDSQLTVMTYNVLFSNLNYDAVANVILTYQPDLVALQEVKLEMMNALKYRLQNDYPYSLMGTENDFGTTAVFSSYPFTDSYVLDLHVDRPATIVKVNVNGHEVTFVAVHLLAYGLRWVGIPNIPKAVMQFTAEQNRQVEILLDELERENGIVIVACDCNSYETSSSYRILDKSMNSVAQEMGWVLGNDGSVNARQDIDLQHIDFIWYREPLTPVGIYKILDSGGSDHLPVLVNFSIR